MKIAVILIVVTIYYSAIASAASIKKEQHHQRRLRKRAFIPPSIASSLANFGSKIGFGARAASGSTAATSSAARFGSGMRSGRLAAFWARNPRLAPAFGTNGRTAQRALAPLTRRPISNKIRWGLGGAVALGGLGAVAAVSDEQPQEQVSAFDASIVPDPSVDAPIDSMSAENMRPVVSASGDGSLDGKILGGDLTVPAGDDVDPASNVVNVDGDDFFDAGDGFNPDELRFR